MSLSHSFFVMLIHGHFWPCVKQSGTVIHFSTNDTFIKAVIMVIIVTRALT